MPFIKQAEDYFPSKDNVEEWLKERTALKEKVDKKAMKNIMKAQEKQREAYAKRRGKISTDIIKQNDRIYVFDARRHGHGRQEKKVGSKYDGPFTVVEVKPHSFGYMKNGKKCYTRKDRCKKFIG